MPRILLVRHGRSSHVHAGWIDAAGFARWRDAYEAAGIADDDPPPIALRDAASQADIVVASDAARAVASASRLSARVITTPLLRELELAPPLLGRLRLPLAAWTLLIGVRWGMRALPGQPTVAPHESQRAHDAARWLAELAASHESVVAVTHGSLRLLVAQRLIADGWRCERPRKAHAHWSAWSLTR
ncbi:MAG TPA: hypothetical protein VF824_18480 [Thermoanaerobaculia bacterium]|jgi:broad specificity phosphatase PhoE